MKSKRRVKMMEKKKAAMRKMNQYRKKMACRLKKPQRNRWLKG